MNRQNLVRRFVHQAFIYFQLKFLFIRKALSAKNSRKILKSGYKYYVC